MFKTLVRWCPFFPSVPLPPLVHTFHLSRPDPVQILFFGCSFLLHALLIFPQVFSWLVSGRCLWLRPFPFPNFFPCDAVSCGPSVRLKRGCIPLPPPLSLASSPISFFFRFPPKFFPRPFTPVFFPCAFCFFGTRLPPSFPCFTSCSGFGSCDVLRGPFSSPRLGPPLLCCFLSP